MTLGDLQSIADKIRTESGAPRVEIVIGEGDDRIVITSTAS